MELENKKVLVVGLGKSGRSAALFLRRRGALVTVSDLRSAEVLAQDIPALLDAGIIVETGGHGLLTFRRQDLIVVSPGVPLDTPQLVQAKSFGLPVIGELELAARFLKGKVLAVTGSNGKTTTTTLLGEILRQAGLATLVGGNIGVPVVDLIDKSTDASWSVLEVSSFQLESTEEFHPSIAVILNITPDHLDRHGSFENYGAAKERIFARQTAEDCLVLNADNPRAAEAASRSAARVYWFSIEHPVAQGAWLEQYLEQDFVVYRSAPDAATEKIMPLSEIPLKGAHNVENVLAAICAARLVGVPGDRSSSLGSLVGVPGDRSSSLGSLVGVPGDRSSSLGSLADVPADVIRRAIKNFQAVEHRLEFVATRSGVAFYNDSKATNVDATAKAVAAFSSGIHLILGGKDKNSDYTQLSELLRERVRAVYTIGAAAAKIESHLRGVVSLRFCATLDQAVAAAAAAARPGEVVLLAPACSSFDQFENYEQRGRVFKQLVQELRD